MDISSEKAEIMKRFEQIRDISLIRAIKTLLDFGLSKQADNEALSASIEKGLNESKKGTVKSHEDIMPKIRARYKS
jgi:predicted transcriptional regulator